MRFELIFPQQYIHIYKIIFGGGGGDKLIFNSLKFMYVVNCGKLQSQMAKLSCGDKKFKSKPKNPGSPQSVQDNI